MKTLIRIDLPAGKITQNMNERNFSLLRVNSLTDAYSYIVVGENIIDPITKKHVLSAAAYSNELNIAYTFNVLNYFMRTYPNVFISHKLRAETGRENNRPKFIETHDKKSRESEKDPITYGYDRLLVVNINGKLIVVNIVIRHRTKKFNISVMYMIDSITKDIENNPKVIEKICKENSKIFKRQMFLFSVGENSWEPAHVAFRNGSSYPDSSIYTAPSATKKNCLDFDAGKLGFVSTKFEIKNIFNETVSPLQDFYNALQKAIVKDYNDLDQEGKWAPYKKLMKGKK